MDSKNISSFTHLHPPISVNGVNPVYKSSNMELSKYINKMGETNLKSNELGGYKAMIENKGSRCQCNKVLEISDARNVCGPYCKNLYPSEQKKIILETLKRELQIANTSFTAGSKKSSTPIKGNSNKNDPKFKRYLLDAKWWRKWCDYTNFDSSLLSLTVNQSDLIDDHLSMLQSTN